MRIKVYFPRTPKQLGEPPYKTLTANSDAELAALLRIGWKLDPPQEEK